MSRITTQSIFHTSVHKPSWQSYIVSTTVHVGLAALAFMVIVPVAVEVHKSLDHITYLAPVPELKPPPPVVHLIAPKIIPHPIAPPLVKTFVPPPVVAPVIKPKPIVEAPEIKPAPVQPELKVDLPPAPKAPIKTGVFQPTVELAKGPPPPPQQKVQVGGFGDPHGVPPSENSRPSAATLAKVGAFDMPEGAGKSGRNGGSQTGGELRQTGFGVPGEQGRPKTTTAVAQTVRSTAFGDATLAPPPPVKKVENVADNQTPVQILSKPRPAYTPEARELRLEGEVSLQVVFQADGTIHVLRVVRGLGHGLDEAAVQAATRVRFKPATRGGVPVDTNATIKISFELT
jgi:TonB family protein